MVATGQFPRVLLEAALLGGTQSKKLTNSIPRLVRADFGAEKLELKKYHLLQLRYGGGRGIRTPGGLAPTLVFKTRAINHSAIPPDKAAVSGPARRPSYTLRARPSRRFALLSQALPNSCPKL